MPPYYDIYGFSKKRDSKLIEDFLHKYAWRENIEKCEGCELAIYKNEKYKIEEKWIPIKTLTEVIEYGIRNINDGFAFYISSEKYLKNNIKDLILKFTYDSGLILGLSIETTTEIGENNFKRAEEIEKELRELFALEATSIQGDYAPADDLEEFYEDLKMWNKLNKKQINS